MTKLYRISETFQNLFGAASIPVRALRASSCAVAREAERSQQEADDDRRRTVTPAAQRSAACPDEAHRLRRDQVHKVAGGYKIDGYPLTIPDTSALPSQDENFWAFYKTYGIVDDKPQVSSVHCFFVPFGV